jgi:hypothetical protein
MGFSPCNTSSKRVFMALRARVTGGMREWGDGVVVENREWWSAV